MGGSVNDDDSRHLPKRNDSSLKRKGQCEAHNDGHSPCNLPGGVLYSVCRREKLAVGLVARAASLLKSFPVIRYLLVCNIFVMFLCMRENGRPLLVFVLLDRIFYLPKRLLCFGGG